MAIPEKFTLDYVKENAQKRFPKELIKKNSDALCLFSSSTQGRTDLIHLFNAGLGNVTVIDPNKPKMNLLGECFDRNWKYIIDDCGSKCRQLVNENKKYAIVICDGSNGIVDHIWEELFPLCYVLSRQSVVIKITGEYLNIHGLEANKDGIAELLKVLHVIELTPDAIIKRSSGKNGVFWIVFKSIMPEARQLLVEKFEGIGAGENTKFHDIKEGKLLCVELKDLLSEFHCENLPSCRATVNTFRENIYRKERQSIFRVMTSARFIKQPVALIAGQDKTAACFDLERFNGIDEIMDAARTVTEKRGRVNREVNKAIKKGYLVKQFHTLTYIPDIHAIHHSKEVRGGKSMKGQYLQSIEEMGGYPDKFQEVTEPACSVHYDVMWGVMSPEIGHRQGSVITNERLVAYIHLYRYGNHCWYSRIMGHADYLQDGIMYLLHFTLAEILQGSKKSGLRYILYGGTRSGPKDGNLQNWKRRALFEPRYIIYDEAGEWAGNRGMNYLS